MDSIITFAIVAISVGLAALTLILNDRKSREIDRKFKEYDEQFRSAMHMVATNNRHIAQTGVAPSMNIDGLYGSTPITTVNESVEQSKPASEGESHATKV